MLAPVTHILPVTVIRRDRVLPGPGKILVRKGQKVSAIDVVAEAKVNPEHMLIDVGRGLGLSGERADQYIQCKPGDRLAEGDIIAGPIGVSRRVMRSPREGQVILCGNGQVLLEVTGKLFQLKAGLPGDVVDLIADRGVMIETTGALIQGVWGNGHVEYGVMSVLAKHPDQVLTPDQLDVSLRGSIVMAAHCEDPEALKTGEELPLRGLILASMSSALVPRARQVRIPIILLEGFGQHPMNPVAFKLLTTNVRREVSLNAELMDRYAGTRPEIVIPLPGTSSLTAPRETDRFAPDQQVRIVRAPFAGSVGTIVGLKGQVLLPSGLKAQAAEVRLDDDQKVVIPLANLEILA
jgi:hypothetical protein